MSAPSLSEKLNALSLDSKWVVHADKPNVDPFVESMLRAGGGTVCVAGGYAILSGIDGLNYSELSDVDVWALGPDTKTKQQAANRAIEWLANSGSSVAGAQKDKSVMCFSLAHYQRNVQLIIPDTNDVAQLLDRFDIDACQAALIWNAQNNKVDLITTDICRAAWKSRTIIQADSWVKQSRLIKLQLRGFKLSPKVSAILTKPWDPSISNWPLDPESVLKEMQKTHFPHDLKMSRVDVYREMCIRMGLSHNPGPTFNCNDLKDTLVEFDSTTSSETVYDQFGARYHRSCCYFK